MERHRYWHRVSAQYRPCLHALKHYIKDFYNHGEVIRVCRENVACESTSDQQALSTERTHTSFRQGLQFACESQYLAFTFNSTMLLLSVMFSIQDTI